MFRLPNGALVLIGELTAAIAAFFGDCLACAFSLVMMWDPICQVAMIRISFDRCFAAQRPQCMCDLVASIVRNC